jgi:hypothetical protein
MQMLDDNFVHSWTSVIIDECLILLANPPIAIAVLRCIETGLAG